MDQDSEQWVFVCSDSVGETAERVVRATMKQFAAHKLKIKRYSHLQEESQIYDMLEEASQKKGFIAYTLVQPELRELMKVESIRLGIRAVDIMGPMMQAFVDTFNNAPLSQPGLLHRLDEDYFRRVEAMEYAVRCDDGRDPKSMLAADIVLIGISRTSKTPLSIYLAHKGYKVANLPLMPEVKPPEELTQIPSRKLLGLTMEPSLILRVRQERLKSLGLAPTANYVSQARIQEELDYAHAWMRKLNCKIVDVSAKAIEETAGHIIEIMNHEGGDV